MGNSFQMLPTIHADMRSKLPRVRDQGTRPLCLVFASSDLNSYVNETTAALSVEYLAHHSYKDAGHENYRIGLPIHSVQAALRNNGQPFEAELPYRKDALEPLCSIGNYNNLFFAELSQKSDFFSDLIEKITSNEPAVLCISIPDSFFSPQPPFVFDREEGDVGGHAVVAVGLGSLANGEPSILIRNSWGEAWGIGGHAWVTITFLKQRLIGNLGLE